MQYPLPTPTPAPQKRDTVRSATAGARVLLGPQVCGLVASNQLAKGDVLTVAQLAGVMGAKQTAALIPLCHNIPLSKVGADVDVDAPCCHCTGAGEGCPPCRSGRGLGRVSKTDPPQPAGLLLLPGQHAAQPSWGSSSMSGLCTHVYRCALLAQVGVHLSLDPASLALDITASATTVGPTGVEMEALTAAGVAALTVYDMCKAASKDIVITDVRLLSKSGGRSGDYRRAGGGQAAQGSGGDSGGRGDSSSRGGGGSGSSREGPA